MVRKIALVLVLCLVVPVVASARRRAVRSPMLYPPCSMVTGTAAVTFTLDEGATLAPSAVPLVPVSYTWGLAAMLDDDATLVAWNRNDLLISTDAGCSWRVAATIEGADFPPTITAAPGGRAYAWSENRRFLVRFDSRGAKTLKQPVDFMGLGVDPNNGEHVRAGGNDGTVWESTDGGETWTQIGSLKGPTMIYRFAFDPKDLNHIVAGVVGSGAHVSRDGGQTWTQSTGLAPRSANVFQVVFSPVDSNRVWAMGLDLDAPDNALDRRHIYASDDGGATFRAVVDGAPGISLINGPTMAAHPTNRDVVYFVFGTYYDNYGTDIFRYDDASRTLVIRHNDQQGVNAIAFSRRDPSVMYLGLERVK